jgi:hypothetical protein
MLLDIVLYHRFIGGVAKKKERASRIHQHQWSDEKTRQKLQGLPMFYEQYLVLYAGSDMMMRAESFENRNLSLKQRLCWALDSTEYKPGVFFSKIRFFLKFFLDFQTE